MYFLYLCLSIISVLTSFNVHANEYELVLEQALKSNSSKGDFPVTLFLEHDGTSFTTAKAVSFYYPFQSWESFDVDVSGLSLSGGSITGNIQTTVEGISLNTNVDAVILSDGFIEGRHHGSSDGMTCIGGIEGRESNALDFGNSYHASIFLQEAATTDQTGTVVVNIETNGSTVTNVTLTSAAISGSLYGSTIYGPHAPSFITPSGVVASQLAWFGDIYSYSVTGNTLTLTADTLYGDIQVEKFNEGVSEGNFTYTLNGKIVAGYYIGNYTETDPSSAVRTELASGNIAQAKDLPEASLAPIQREASQSGTGFLPPYFKDISQGDFVNRMQAAANWFSQSAYIGAFSSNAASSIMGASNSKQYDNEAENSYGGAMGNIMLSRLTDDPELKKYALQSAQRAGYWIQARGEGSYNKSLTYKGQLYTDVWRGLAYLELYLETGDVEWLENARQYAFMLEHLQTRMYDSVAMKTLEYFGNHTGGAWTYYGGESGDYLIGVTNSRNDRSRDWTPTQAAEYLYFLGKLRVEGGIDDYLHVEKKAYQWILANIEASGTGLHGTEAGAWYEANRDAMGPTQFLRYMLLYAQEKTDEDINTVLADIESKWSTWSHSTSDFTPGINAGGIARMQGTGQPETSTTLRMALVYMELYKIRGAAEYFSKAKSLIYSVLSRQNAFGYINGSGILFNSADAADNFTSRFNEEPAHPYSNFSAEALHLLNECYLDFSDLEGFGASSVIASLEADETRGEAPFTVNFDASQSRGNAVSYVWDFGDGNSSTSATPSHTYSTPGNYSVRLTVTDGTNLVYKEQLISVTEPLVLSEIDVVPVDRILAQNAEDVFDHKNYLMITESAQYKAKAIDQYGLPIEPQPTFTWDVNGNSTVDNTGYLEAQPTAGDNFNYEVSATADIGDGPVTGSSVFRVIGFSNNRYTGISVNFTKDDENIISHPDFTAGIIKLNGWNNIGEPSWGTQSISASVWDAEGVNSVSLSNSSVKGGINHSFPQLNSDVVMTAGEIIMKTDEPIVVSNIPASFQSTGYDVYVYELRRTETAGALSLSGDTVWVKGSTAEWDGSSYSRAIATTSADALAGDHTNYALFENLTHSQFDVHVSNIQGMQIVQRIDGMLDQTINFLPLSDKVKTDAPFRINAVASSGLPISYAVVSGPATITGDEVTLSGNTGTVVIQASQGGNADYNAATTVEQSFVVTKLNQDIVFQDIADKTISDSPFDVTASSSSALPITFQIVSGPASISGNTITLDGTAGLVVVKAIQSGNNDYKVAEKTRHFLVYNTDIQTQSISFDSIPDKQTNDDPFSITATATSGLSVSFSILSGPATVSGNTITLTGDPGEVTVRASQVGNGNYFAAPDVEQTFSVVLLSDKRILPVDMLRLDLYPNPASDMVIVAVPQELSLLKVFVYSVDGILLDSFEPIYTDRFLINVANYRNGMYLVKVFTDRGDQYIRRLIINK